MNSVRTWLCLAALATLPAGLARGQEFRIFTVVSLESGGDAKTSTGRPDVLARSLTLFHAGKVYDYVEPMGEVIVLEPAHHRFLVLNEARDLGTSVEFDELNNLLKVARRETEAYVGRLEKDGDEKSLKAASQFRFQLAPRFEESWDEKTRRLTMSSHYLRYSALCAIDDAAPEVLESWLRYADAMCRLNYVLHPGALFPESRLAVNAALAKHRKLPVEVELMANVDSTVHLRARHQIHWELDAKDRDMINNWEKLIQKKSPRLLTFKEYMRASLAAQPAKTK